MDKFHICCNFDAGYWDLGTHLIKSILVNYPTSITCHVFNLHKTQVAKLKDLPNVEVISHKDANKKKDRIPSYYNFRSHIMRDILEKHDNVLYLDSDCVVTDSLDSVFDKFKSFNFATHCRFFHENENMKFLNYFIALKKEQVTLDMMSQWDAWCKNHNVFFADQLYLYYCYTKFIKDIRLLDTSTIKDLPVIHLKSKRRKKHKNNDKDLVDQLFNDIDLKFTNLYGNLL